MIIMDYYSFSWQNQHRVWVRQTDLLRKSHEESAAIVQIPLRKIMQNHIGSVMPDIF